ncbi:MAG: extracellular solute-binding protein [Chloroflexi bacterium]|nr:extracellular solute-binding protein [Chloroflexota bacterium]
MTTLSTRPCTRRVTLTAGAGALAGAALAACAPGQQADAPAAGTPGKLASATLQLWTIWGGTRVPLMDEQFSRFSQKYPGVTVEHNVLPGGERLEKILTAMASGTPPDVPMIGRQEIPLFVEKVGGLTQLDSYMTRDKVTKSIFYDAEINACMYGGKTWGLPMPTAGTYGNLYYNRAWLTREGIDPDKNPPRTWDELQELARKLTQREAGKLTKLGFPVDINGLQFWHWLGLNGGKLWSDDGRKMVLDKAEDTLQWMVDFREKVAGGRSGLQGFPPSGGNAFYNAHLAQTISGVWTWFYIKTEAPDIQAGVYLRPARTGGEPKYLSLEAWAYGVSKGGKYPEHSWRLAKFLSAEKDGGGWFMQQQGRPSPVKEFNQAAEMKQISPYWDVLLKALDRSAAPATFLPVHTDVVKAINDNVSKLNQEQSTVRETVANIRQEAQRVIDEFWATKGR